MLFPYSIEDPEGLPPRRPLLTLALVGANVAVFVVQLLLGPAWTDASYARWGFVPEEWTRLHTMVTALFLHGGLLHLLGNMYFLWVFGRLVEDRLGAVRAAGFYLACGAGAFLAHLWTTPPMRADVICVGASGAISGLLGGFLVLAPQARVKCVYVWVSAFLPILGTVSLSATLFLGLWFTAQLLYALTLRDLPQVSAVAFWAHVGGFLAGAALLAAGRGGRQLARWRSRQARAGRLERLMTSARQGRWDDGCEAEIQRMRQEEGEVAAEATLVRAMRALPRPADARRHALAVLRAEGAPGRPAVVTEALCTLAEPGGADDAAKPRPEDFLLAAAVLGGLGQSVAQEAVLAEALRRWEAHPQTPHVLEALAELYGRNRDAARRNAVWACLAERYPQFLLHRSRPARAGS